MFSNPWRDDDPLADGEEESREPPVAASERVQAAASSARTSSIAGNRGRSGRDVIRSVMGEEERYQADLGSGHGIEGA
jgi:hypothetical protein